MTMSATLRTIPAGQFKARCLALLDEVGHGDSEIIVTKRGKPVAKLVRVEQPGRPSLKWMLNSIGDVESPIDEAWDAQA